MLDNPGIDLFYFFWIGHVHMGDLPDYLTGPSIQVFPLFPVLLGKKLIFSVLTEVSGSARYSQYLEESFR